MIIEQNASDVTPKTQNDSEIDLAGASQALYAELIRQNPDHLLVLIDQHFDFDDLFAEATAYRTYQPGGRGQDETHPTAALCKALLVKYLLNLSFAQTIEQIRLNWLVRYFVGYALHEEPLSAVTLQRFAVWSSKNGLDRTFFTDSLLQIREDHPDEVDKDQVGDTFALYSRARPQSRSELLRHACRRLLEYVESEIDDAHRHLLDALDCSAIFGAEDEPREYLLPKAQRVAREEATALAAAPLLALAQSMPPTRSLTRLALQRWSQLLEKILHDEFSLEMDDDGRVLNASLRDKHLKGAYVIGSTVDPQATFRNHGKACDLAFNISVTATDNFIHEIAAATGATPDSSGIVPLLHQQQEHLGTLPPKLVYDQAAGYPKFFAQVQRVTNGRTQLVARMVRAGRKGDRFGPLDFSLDDQGHLTCPNGKVTSVCYRSKGKDRSGWNYRFSLKQCTGCPLMDLCRKKKEKPANYRQVFISDYLYQQRQALDYQQTDDFAQDMKGRSQIERIIAGLVRYNGARRADSYGLRNADFQVRMAAAAYNLKRWASLQREQRRELRRRRRTANAVPAADPSREQHQPVSQPSDTAINRNKGDPAHASPHR